MPVQISPNPDTRRQSSAKQAVNILRSMIVSNKLAPGSNHLESELADLLNMSRTPIREAVFVLEAQGLLEVRPRRGVRILALSPTDMAEIYEVLTELESLAAELAAKAEHPAKEYRKAERAIKAMDDALTGNHREAWAEADEIFHNELVRLGGNSRIANIVDMYGDQTRRARALTLYLRPTPIKSNDDHRNVLRAIRDGDWNAARELHRAHRLQSRVMLVELLEEYGFRQV